MSQSRRTYQRLQGDLPYFLAEFMEPTPTGNADLQDEDLQPHENIQDMCSQLIRQHTLMGNIELLTLYYRLGRVLATIGTQKASQILRQWMARGKAQHMRWVATRTYEVFELQGTAYLSATSLTPTIL